MDAADIADIRADAALFLPDVCNICTKTPAKTGTGGTTYTYPVRHAAVPCRKSTVQQVQFVGGQRVSVAVVTQVACAAETDVITADVLDFAGTYYEVTEVLTRGAMEVQRTARVKAINP